MTVVADASVIVAALTAPGETGAWAEGQLRSDLVLAPHLAPAEVASTLRRLEAQGILDRTAATAAHRRLVGLDVTLVPYAPLAARIWELRSQITTYDAWYVALAERAHADLATLDARLGRASLPRCGFRVPPDRHP